MLRKALFGLFILLWVPGSAFSVLTASDLVNRARTLLKDASTSANRQQFSDSQYLAWASDGQREANAQSWLLQSSVTVSLAAGTSEYVMPGDFMFPNRVWYNGIGLPTTKLPASSFNDLDARYSGWQSAQAGPATVYYVDMSSASVLLGVWPVPGTTSTGTLTVYYVQNTVDLTASNESAIPFNGWLSLQPYISALPYYMAYRAYLTLEEPDIAKAYLDYWISYLLIMRQGINRLPDFNPPAGALRSGSPSGIGGMGGP